MAEKICCECRDFLEFMEPGIPGWGYCQLHDMKVWDKSTCSDFYERGE